MGDSSRPHELPHTSTPVASIGQANDGRCGPISGATSTSTDTGKQCNSCGISLEKKARSAYREIDDGHQCLTCYRKRTRDEASDDETEDEEPMSQDEAKVDLRSMTITYNYQHQCILRNCPPNAVLTRIPTRARQQVLNYGRKYIPKGARCCKPHLRGRLMKPELIDEIPTSSARFKGSQIDDMLSLLIEKKVPRHEFTALDDHELKVFTGRTRDQFEELAAELELRSSFDEKRSTILGVYLAYLYAGFTQEQISATFTVPRKTVANYIKLGRDSLTPFVNNNLGLQAMTRDILCEHRTSNAELLYGLEGTTRIVTVWDATYEYLPKSSNFRFQAATYSGNKKRNLLKPMVAVTPDGLIVDTFGPDNLWKANMSDADILARIMELPDFRERFQPGDLFIVDRGFRNVKKALEERQYVVKIPPHLVGKQKQLTVEQANAQRECTAIRWIVEVINRQLKCNKYLARTLSVQAVPHLLQDTRIAAAIHNKFGTRILAYSDDRSVVTGIVNRLNLPNDLQRLVEDKRLTRQKSAFQIMDGQSIPDFPEIDPVGLRTMLGNYGINLAKSYYADHTYGEEGYQIHIGRVTKFTTNDFQEYGIIVQRPLFIRVKLQSRHSRNKLYQAYLLCDLNQTSVKSIIGFYCQCIQGARSVSPCAHVSSVIWFLGHGRHLETIRIPSEFLNRHFPEGVPTAESENEDEDD